MDNTLLTGPVEQDSAAPKRLNSLLPQVSAEVMDKLLAEVQAEPDPEKLRGIFEARLELFQRENPILYFRLSQHTTPEQMGWIVYVYRALAEQNQKDMRYPA